MLWRLMIVLGGLAAAAVAQVLPVGTIDGTVQDSTRRSSAGHDRYPYPD